MMVVLAVGSVGAGAAVSSTPAGGAAPRATCDLPGQVLCVTDTECVSFNALCDPVQNFCVCISTDMGRVPDGFMPSDGGADFGGGDLGGPADFATPAGSPSAPPATGGGMTSTMRTGCSYVPGSVW